MKFPAQRLAAWATLLAVSAITNAASAQESRPQARLPEPPRPSIDVPKVAITQFTLPNGLRVVLHEDHSSPIVAVQTWYHVGSKDEAPGKTGLAHMFEHLMDEGTLNMPTGEFKRTIQEAGGNYNAFTGSDWTYYRMAMPSNQLETALWLDAERMANLSPTLDSTRFRLEREAVRNEYRQNVFNSAVASGGEAIFEALFGDGTYRQSPIGVQSELASTTVEDLKSFYEKYYVPNNAVLVIVGDFNSADARQKVTKHFSAIPRGKAITRPRSVGTLVGEKRIVVEHASGQRQLWHVWRGANSAAPDRAAALALSAILEERMRKLLINERRLASFMNPAMNANFDLEESGVFETAVVVTGSATEVERLVDSLVADIKANGVTPLETKRWIAAYRLEQLTEMQGIVRKAELLGDAALMQRDPLANFSIVQRAQAVTPQAVQAAARKYLTGNRVILNIIPTGKFDLISKPELPYTNLSRKP